MSCHSCKCNYCARSCELFSGYFTPGEVGDIEKVCYTCDECKWWDGDHRKRSLWRGECQGYMEAAKYTEATAAARRRNFKVLPGGKSFGISEVSHETTKNKP